MIDYNYLDVTKMMVSKNFHKYEKKKEPISILISVPHEYLQSVNEDLSVFYL